MAAVWFSSFFEKENVFLTKRAYEVSEANALAEGII